MPATPVRWRRYPDPVSRVEILHRPTPDVDEFVEHRCPDLSDLGLVTLHHGESGYLGVVARRPADRTPSTPSGPGDIVGYAQISAAHHSRVLEVCAPDELVAELVGTALAEIPPGELVRWWIHHTPHHHQSIAHRLGFTGDRVLHEMRRRLPSDRRSSITTRAFDPSTDRQRWLEVNNRAFAEHPEQGGWSLADFDHRRAEPWHDDDALRLLEMDGRLAGFCWVKTHESAGEIYAIAVDPDHHGQGLGRELSLAGLDWMAEHRLSEALLFVDADNHRATAMYEQLGFTTVRTDRSYVITV